MTPARLRELYTCGEISETDLERGLDIALRRTQRVEDTPAAEPSQNPSERVYGQRRTSPLAESIKAAIRDAAGPTPGYRLHFEARARRLAAHMRPDRKDY